MQRCDFTGKGKQYGSNVSFSQRHTKKIWKPNLQTKTVVINGRPIKMKLSTQAIRTLKKNGVIGQTNAPVAAPVTAPATAAKTQAPAKTPAAKKTAKASE